LFNYNTAFKVIKLKKYLNLKADRINKLLQKVYSRKDSLNNFNIKLNAFSRKINKELSTDCSIIKETEKFTIIRDGRTGAWFLTLQPRIDITPYYFEKKSYEKLVIVIAHCKLDAIITETTSHYIIFTTSKQLPLEFYKLCSPTHLILKNCIGSFLFLNTCYLDSQEFKKSIMKKIAVIGVFTSDVIDDVDLLISTCNHHNAFLPVHFLLV
jgi:hypothetical protein